MHDNPRIVSFILRVFQLIMTFVQVDNTPSLKNSGKLSGKERSFLSIPKTFANCLDAIVIDAADVKPPITGTDIKSITKPNRKIPNNDIITPHMKARRIAYSNPLIEYSAVKMDIIAVGPTVTSLLLPNIKYMKHPINAEYSPYYKMLSILNLYQIRYLLYHLFLPYVKRQ